MARSQWWWMWIGISGLIGMVLVGRTIPARAQSVARMGFVWANNATAPTYTPNSEFSHNSADEAITITKSGRGRYKVRFTGLGGNGTLGGHVQVTAYGDSSDTCKVKSWNSSGRDFIVNVNCFNAQGTRIDTQYTVLVVWPEPLSRHTLTVVRTGPLGGVVTSNPAGINCGQDCVQPYKPGTVVRLTAQATSAAIFFAGWSGDCSSNQSHVTITMNADKQCIARFASVPN